MGLNRKILRGLFNIWNSISNIGVSNYTRLGSAKAVILTNRVSFVIIWVCIIVFLNYWFHQLYFVGYIQIATVLLMILPLVFNAQKCFRAAKVVLFSVVNANIFMTSSSLGYETAEHYGYFAIVIGVFILFDKSERLLRWIFTLLPCVLLITLELTNYSLFLTDNMSAGVRKLLSLFNTSGTLAIILLCINYFRKISDQHISDIIRNTYDELKGVFDSSHDAILLLDPQNYDIIECNDRARIIFHYHTREEIIGKNFFSLQKENTNTAQQAQVRNNVSANKAWVSDEIYLTEDGREFWGNLAVTKMVLEDKTMLVARITDITENKQVAILLENLTHDLKKVQGIIKLGYWHLDVSTNNITYHSEEAGEQFSLQRQPAEISFKTFTENVHPTDLPRFLSAIERSLKFQIPFELELRVKSGRSTKWLHTKSDLVLLDDGSVSNIICTSLDITERKLAEEKVKTSERNYRKLASNLPDTDVFLFDEKLKIILAEGAIMQKHNMSSSYFEGKTIDDIMDHTYRAFIKPLYETVLRGKGISSDVALRDEFINFRGVPLRDANQHVYGGIMVCQDITARKKNEQELIKAKDEAENASRAKALFLSTMSHELRTPLNAVIGMAHLLLQDNPRPEQAENLKILHFSAENLLALINDILDFSKIDANKVDFEKIAFDIRDITNNIIQTHKKRAEEKKLKLSLSVADDVPEKVIGDPTKLAQILNNLISNAVKFTETGYVAVNIEVVERKKDASMLSFSVKDTGVGIPEEKLEAIFEQFSQADSNTTRRFGGTGLGLTITKRLLELQHSHISVISAVGEGATFSFNLNFEHTDESVAKNTATPNYVDTAVKTAKILAVEDNPANILILTKFLDKWGMTYDIADNGQIAVERAFLNNYDLILMDLQMPVMDGYQAAMEIRKKDKYTPIIALTASAFAETLIKVKASGMDDLVTKPFNPADLRQKITMWAQSKHSNQIKL